jgi:signal transduction histidine kinase
VQSVTLQEVRDGRVVVVDDNLPSVQLAQALLTRAGLASVPAFTAGQELLDRWDEIAPDLVLLDLHMPGLDGYAMLTELRRRASSADLPVLVLTADTTREAAHRALQLGASDFLTKPLDAAELVLRVRNLLRARASHVGLERRHRWLEASARLARELLSGTCADPLREVCELARDAAGADFALIAPADSAGPTDMVVDGELPADAGEIVARAFAAGGFPAGQAMRLADLGGAIGRPDLDAVGGAALVPLIAGERALGTLLLCRLPGRAQFAQTDVELAAGFADQAAVAVEFAQARADQERMLVLADRHRIARDLHDQVIQRLFAIGLRLQQLEARLEPAIAARLEEQLGDLDDTISEIRSTIFGLRQAGPTSDRLPVRMRRLATELTEVLGFAPDLHVDAPLDVVPEELTDDIVAAAREAVTNVARHAGANRVQLSVTLTGTDVILEVVDDGVGIGTAERRSGLTNLCERAVRHGGSCAIGPAVEGGTHIAWTAPLVPEPQYSTREMASGR